MKNVLVFVVFAFVQIASAEQPLTRNSGKIAKGTEWETEFIVVDSGKPGATVLLIGGVHGNEPAGSRAAEQISHWPIQKGKLVLIPRANVKALEANKRLTPNQPGGEGDLNRNFPRVKVEEKEAVLPRGELAAALWRFAFKVQPDWVIDLHEGFEFHRSHKPGKGKKRSVGSSVIYNASNVMDPLAKRIALAADELVTDPDKRFSLIGGGPVESGIAQACFNVMGGEVLILETTYKNQPLSLRSRQHRAMVNVLLNHIGTIDHNCVDLLAPAKRPASYQVAVFDGIGTGASRVNLCRVIADAPDMTLYDIGPAEMRPEVLKQFDVVIFPGGSGSKQAKDIGQAGRKAVRTYTENGGGIVGVCAGAYLCSAHFSWSLNLIDSSVFTGSREIPGKGKKQMWFRGKGADIDLELTPAGKALFSNHRIPEKFVIRYCNGPIISPKGLEELDDYRVLAWFRSENGLWKPQEGTMINTPAIVSGKYNKGRVISVSPHPEFTTSLHPIITESIRWAAAESQ
jgi:glutamine amidotransferase-like uncharacterized protein